MITIEQARKKLSKEDNERLSDADVQSIIDDATVVANLAITDYLNSKKVRKRD